MVPETKNTAAPASNGSVTPIKPLAEVPTKPKSTSILILLLFTLLIGILLGAYLTSHLLESEYQSIISKLRNHYQASLSAAKDDSKSRADEIIELKKEKDVILIERDVDDCQDSLKALQSEFIDYEKGCQEEVLQSILSTNQFYEEATAKLAKVSDKYIKLQKEYTALEQKYHTKLRENEDISQLLNTSKRQQSDTFRLVQELKNVVASLNVELEGKEKVIKSHEEELDRRDLERVECDALHRQVFECKKKFEDVTRECPSTHQEWNAEKEELLTQLSTMAADKENALQEVAGLNHHKVQMQEHLRSVTSHANEVEQERNLLNEERASVSERIQVRDQLFVLDR